MRKVEIKDLLHYKFPSNLQYSPDGKLLAFEVSYADEKNNAYKTDVHMIRDGRDVQMTSTLNASILGWKDNHHIILSRHAEDAEKGMNDLYLLSTDGGEAVKWISVPFSIQSLKKVHDDLYIASASFDMHDPDAYLDDQKTREKKIEDHKKNDDYQVVDEVPYWINGAGFTNGKRTGLFVIETNPLKITRITEPSFDTGTYAIDGEIIYFSGISWKGRASLYSNLYAYDLTEKKIRPVYDKGDRSFADIFVLNGKLFVQETDMREYGENETPKLARIDGNDIKELRKPEHSLYCSVSGDTMYGGGRMSTVSDHQWISLMTVEDHTEIHAFDEEMNDIKLYESDLIGLLDTSENKIAFVQEDWNHLGEVYEMNPDGTDVKKLTALNDENLKDVYIAKPVRIDYESAGEKLYGWVLLPENFNKNEKYPAVLDVHGGPRAVYGTEFFHEMQVWCAKGFVVMFTNIRGSDGRGDAFADIRDQYGFVDYQNLMDFTDTVLNAYPEIDQTKLCETGGSYGGFMSNWILTHTDRFCAIASQRSISNWISMSLISDIGIDFGPDQSGAKGLFGKENTEKLWKHSPLAYAQNAKTPTLFIHSDEDYRCPLPEGMQMMQALAAQGIETRMCIFHGENHELSRSGKPLHRIRRLEEITKWFEEHTNGKNSELYRKSSETGTGYLCVQKRQSW